MRRFPLPVTLFVVALAIVGALLHPLALVLSVSPFDPAGVVKVLGDVRSTIADLLGWGVLGLLLVMVGYVIRGRLFDKEPPGLPAAWLGDGGPPRSSNTTKLRVTVVITAYNDAEATAQAVRDFREIPEVVKVLVIDNNSTDRTSQLACEAGGTVIRETKQGYGYTCIRGLAEGLAVPESDVILLTEGDGTFVAEDTGKFLAYMDHADLVVGNRVVRGLVETGSQMDYFFTWGNMAVAMLLRLRFWDGRFLGPAGLTDVGCTFRAIRRQALERILPDLHVGGNHFSPHMLLVAMAHGLSVVEIPIRFRRRIGQSKGASQSLWKGFEVGMAMIWHVLTFTPNPAPQRPGFIVERDGLIIRHRHDDPDGPTHVEFVPGAPEGLAALSRHGHRVVVVGDRTHHERAGLSVKEARAIDARIAAEVERGGGRIDAFVVCPHATNKHCSCRHPRPQLLLRAARRSSFELSKAVVVSDRPDFLHAAEGLGCATILVGDEPATGECPVVTSALNLAAAVELALAWGTTRHNSDSRSGTVVTDGATRELTDSRITRSE